MGAARGGGGAKVAKARGPSWTHRMAGGWRSNRRIRPVAMFTSCIWMNAWPLPYFIRRIIPCQQSRVVERRGRPTHLNNKHFDNRKLGRDDGTQLILYTILRQVPNVQDRRRPSLAARLLDLLGAAHRVHRLKGRHAVLFKRPADAHHASTSTLLTLSHDRSTPIQCPWPSPFPPHMP